MTQATTKDYWISPSALHIELNALGNPDYIQASCMSGAQILVYVKDIIGFDAGHNYRRWPLQAAPTVFNTHTEKYVYAAIPRDMTLDASAWIVFPSEQIDIYGKNEKEEQIGDENYYYIFLQGIITSSGDNGTVQRDWKEGCRIASGYLSSDEAVSAIPYDSEWYNYASADSIVTFLKDITMKAGTKFRQLFAKTLTIKSGGKITFEDQGEVNGVATTGTQFESTDKIVTPKFLDDNALSKVKQDVAQEIIRFLKGLTLGENTGGNNFGISSDGIATLKEVVSAAFRSGALGSGFKLGNYSDSEDSYLEVDRLLVRKAAEFIKLVIRELQSVGGEIVLSPASMKISKVDYLQKGTLLPEYGTYPLRYDVYRCSFLTKRGDEEITNPFAVGDLVRCQTFNIKEGTTANAKNKYYWRRVTMVGTDYIDILALSGGNYGDSQPEVGDELVQMGNTTDTARQSVLYLSAYGDDSPSIKLYKGVNDYTLDGKEIFVVSPDEIYALASMFKLKVKGGSTTKEMTLAELVLNVDGLTSTVATNKQEVDGQIGKINTTLSQNAESISSLAQKQMDTENKMTKIEQSTEKISLQVETTTNLKNCIVGSAFRKWDSYTTNNSNYPVTFHTGGVGGSRFLRISSVGASANTWAGISLDCAGMKANTRYTCSVWFRTRTKPDSEVYMRVSGKSSASGTFSIYSTQWFTPTGSTDEWTLYKWSFTTPASVYAVKVDLVVLKNGTIHLCRPMIMEGTEYGGWSLSPYDKTEAGKLESGLKKTGVDIEQDTITATANKFMVKNNDGEVTASVNEKGEFEAYSGLFSGFVRKKLTTITPDNIDKYLSKKIPTQDGYVALDFVSAGSYVEFAGDLASKVSDSYPAILLPFYNTTDVLWKKLAADSKTSEDFTSKAAAAYLGQTFIVRNNTSPKKTIQLVGFTSLSGGSTTAHPEWLESGWMAILTCSLVHVATKNTYSIVWNGHNVPFESPIGQSDDGEEPVADTDGETTAEPTTDDPTTTEEEQPKE